MGSHPSRCAFYLDSETWPFLCLLFDICQQYNKVLVFASEHAKHLVKNFLVNVPRDTFKCVVFSMRGISISITGIDYLSLGTFPASPLNVQS